MKVNIQELEARNRRLFEAAGVPAEDARIMTDVLLQTEMRGVFTHGFFRYAGIHLGSIPRKLSSWKMYCFSCLVAEQSVPAGNCKERGFPMDQRSGQQKTAIS